MRSHISYGFLIVLAACNGTRTGNPIGDMDNGKMPDAGTSETDNGGLTGAGGRCKATRSALDSLTAPSPLGFSAEDVLAFAEGEHQSSIHWHDGSGATPETGAHDLTVRITRRDAAARFVSYTEAEQPAGNGLIDIGLPQGGCEGANAIEIDVDLDVTSDGGALDEHVKATLSAKDTTWANVYLNIAAEDLGGALQITANPVGNLTFELKHVSIQLGVSPLGLRGNVFGDFASVDDDAVQMPPAGSTGSSGVAMAGSIADIGDTGCLDGGLPVDADKKLQGFSAQDAIDRVNSAQSVQAKWQDGSTTDVALSLVRDDQAICAIIDPDQAYAFDSAVPFLRIHAVLDAQSDDDRIDAHWPVVVEAIPAADGTLGDIHIAFDDAQLPQSPITDIESAYGVSGVDTSAYDDARATLQFELPNGAVADLTGMLIVSGLTQPMCPPPSEDPSMGTPGCRGTDFTQVEQATFTAQ